MMISMNQERAVVAELYDSRKWKKKVDQMPDYQVHAIYMKHMAELDKGKADKHEQDNLPF